MKPEDSELLSSGLTADGSDVTDRSYFVLVLFQVVTVAAGKQAWIIQCGSIMAPLEQFVISDLPYSMHSS